MYLAAPFEEKFSDIAIKFVERRYQERNEESARCQLKRACEGDHFDFYEDIEFVNELPISSRESAAGRKAFDFFGLLKLFLSCMLKNTVQITDVYQELLDNQVLQLE